MTDIEDPARRERLRRWRLVLGGPAEQSLGKTQGRDAAMDAALAALYDAGGDDSDEARGTSRSAGLGGSAPKVARWLGDIREYFPGTVVQCDMDFRCLAAEGHRLFYPIHSIIKSAQFD